MKSVLLAFALTLFCSLHGFAQSTCVSLEYEQQETRRDPSILYRMQQPLAGSGSFNSEVISGAIGSGSLSVIRIPVVVHILFNKGEQNISNEQIMSQISVLNNDFRLVHKDTAQIPLRFRSAASDVHIEFVLASVNPQGYATSGIVRKQTSSISFGMDDKIKFSNAGGDDAWDSDRYLNIWVGNLSAGIIGYSSVIGADKLRDGIVVRYTAFGNAGTVQAPYTKGRTAVHELGHWMGLRHIWGDQFCGSDGVDDTPQQGNATRGCPTGVISTCSNLPLGNMYNNFMDLTNDECMNMFTNGQRDKMRASFAKGGAHNALLSSNGATGIPLPEVAPVAPAADIAIRMYPNPAVNAVTVDISKCENLIGQFITIHNHLGQQVSQVKITATLTTINIQSLNAGMYFLKAGKQGKPYKLLKATGVTTP
ncbi:MAG: T9SS type A sorting domain-containing protein [Chitinophagaceae bacterium]|nr:T9SS type A sorting domain-containing protein [Chitinophagaceae bacterium]